MIQKVKKIVDKVLIIIMMVFVFVIGDKLMEDKTNYQPNKFKSERPGSIYRTFSFQKLH